MLAKPAPVICISPIVLVKLEMITVLHPSDVIVPIVVSTNLIFNKLQFVPSIFPLIVRLRTCRDAPLATIMSPFTVVGPVNEVKDALLSTFTSPLTVTPLEKTQENPDGTNTFHMFLVIEFPYNLYHQHLLEALMVTALQE